MSAESPANRASSSKLEFSAAISLSRVVVTSVGSGAAAASGANASAAPHAKPAAAAILRTYIGSAFQRCPPTVRAYRRRSPQHLLATCLTPLPEPEKKVTAG